jgi:hypothetical protein
LPELAAAGDALVEVDFVAVAAGAVETPKGTVAADAEEPELDPLPSVALAQSWEDRVWISVGSRNY